MEDTIILYTSLSLVFLVFAFKFLFQSTTQHKNLPPSPPSIPFLGHLHLVKAPMHRFLYDLSKKYGPIFYLRLGSRHAVVVTSAQLAEECFTKNDIIFANRPRTLLGKHFSYDHKTLLQAPYGDHWRNLRRIAVIEVLSSNRLNMFLPVRREEIKRLLGKLSVGSRPDFCKVELKTMFSELTLNIMMRILAGKRYYGDEVEDEEEARRFREIAREILTIFGTSNPGDYFPLLNWFGDFESRIMRLSRRMDEFLQGLVDEHRNNKAGLERMDSMIDHLLSLQESQPDYYTDQIIKALILSMLLAGTDTTAVALEWAMSNLVNHPEVLDKVRGELDSKIGEEYLVDEPDLSKLQYLHDAISETLRLNPSVPLLIPHRSSDDCIVGGYNVPRDTTLLVNMWAIHRDPELWDEPTNFRPERFERDESRTPKLMAFGLGRRACPGTGLAQRTMSLTLALLIQCFEWKRIGEEMVDTTEDPGITLTKAKPLEVMCRARPITEKIVFDYNGNG